MPTKFAVIAVWGEDVATSARFYRDVLGLELLAHHESRPHFKVDGIYFLILKGKPIPPENPEPERFPLFALAVDDLDGAVRGLQAHGVALPWRIDLNPGERWVMFHDPAGNLIEVVQFR
jgi:catechol 2,3-dioxygenase-like lactoylglutathione lyase family enzyme